MRKKKSVLALTASAMVASLAFAVAFGAGENALLDALDGSYSMEFTSKKNKIGTEAYDVTTAHSGSGTATTELGNAVAFDYNSVYNPTNAWQLFKAGGYITNAEAIRGMKSLSITKNSSSASVGVYWSKDKSFTETQYEAFDSSSALTVTCTFGDYLPNYFKLVALGDKNSSIKSMTLAFSCSDGYPMLTAEPESSDSCSTTGTGLYKVGSSVTITASPKDGYEFSGWYEGGTLKSGDASYTFTMPSGEHTYTARCAKKYYSLTLASEDESKGTVSESGTRQYTSSVTIVATPTARYEFAGWYDGSNLISSDASYTFTMPAKAISYTARFSQSVFEVTLASQDDAKGTVAGSGSFKYGTSVSISASPVSGYTFAGWYSGTNLISLDSPYSFAMPKSGVSYVGHFAKLYHVDASSTDTAKGTVSGSGDYGEGLSVTLTANPIGTYTLVTWYDGDANEVGTGLTYTFAMPSSDASYTADFSIVVGSIMEFGSYPQTKVTDSGLISTLNAAAGTLPTSADKQSWTDYGYYASGAVSSYMWYQDVTSGLDKYRGVYFASYRPYYCGNSSSADSSYQDDNGYSASTAYWFKYEPLKWRVLAVDGSKFFLMCDSLIDSQQYYHTSNGGTHWYNGSSVYENNYAASDIRSWLNASFYGLAFSEAEQAKILATTVDNSAATTSSSSNQFACEDTSDKVFLLSYKDATNSAYGLGSNDKRQLRNTDYAKCQGAYNYSTTGQTYTGCGFWWLRSPDGSHSDNARYVHCVGYAGIFGSVGACDNGVSPALWASL